MGNSKPQRRNALIAANAKKDNPKFGIVDFDSSPLEEIDDEREKKIEEENKDKAEEPEVKRETVEKEAKVISEVEEKPEEKQTAPAAKKRGRKKNRQDEKRVVKTYNLTEEAVRYLEVYYMFHKEETPGMIVSEAILSYVRKKDPKVQDKIKLLFEPDEV